LFCILTNQFVSMGIKNGLLALVIMILPILSIGQKTDSLINKLDSLKEQTDTTGQQNKIEPEFYTERTAITPKVFGILLLDDFKQQALSPLHVKAKSWLKGAALGGIIFGMTYLDKPIQQAAVKLRNRNPNMEDVSRTITNIGGVYEVGTFVGIAAYGYIFKNDKIKATTALATQAFITSTFWSTLFKTLSGRTRPANFDPESPLNETRFHGPFYKLPYGDNSAFPSGHAAVAFAAATVYAKEYKNTPIVPIISYSLASLISLSRITENRHWATDILTGAALGYMCGTQVVNNFHRFAKLQRLKGQKKKNKPQVMLNPTIFNGRLMPQLLVNF
jgi:membrane-associated phospholipid phosphatase